MRRVKSRNIWRDFRKTVLVLHKGKVLLDQSYGLADKENKLPFQNDTLFPIGSITKSMTAVAILQLEEQGKLSISDLLSDYMPELPNANKITLHQLLNHSSGLTDFLEVDEIKGDYTKAYSEKEIINSFKNRPLTSNPGEKYAYISSGYYLLGKIIEQVSGETYSTYLQKHIFKPAGVNDTFVMSERNVDKIQVKGYENEYEIAHDYLLVFLWAFILADGTFFAIAVEVLHCKALNSLFLQFFNGSVLNMNSL